MFRRGRCASIVRVTESKINAYSPNDTASRPGTLLLELMSRIIMVVGDRKRSCHLKITKFFEVATNRRSVVQGNSRAIDNLPGNLFKNFLFSTNAAVGSKDMKGDPRRK
jgi:predicted RNA-binding protein with EMAP domain